MTLSKSVTHILIVEDNPGDARLIREMLAEAKGMTLRAEEAGTLRQAQERILRQHFNIILLDPGLPDSQGLLTLEGIQTVDGNTPVIVLTGLDDEALGIQAVQSGAQDYLIKGALTAGLLSRAIHYAVERHKIQTALVVANRELENRVRERTEELAATNARLALSLAGIEEAEHKLRRIVENLNEGIWVIDGEAKTTFVNPRMAEILGYTQEEMEGRHLLSFMDEQGKQICLQHLARRQQGIKEQHEFEFVRKDGTHITTLLETAPISDADGSFAGAVAGVTDITERKRLNEELQRSHDQLRNISKQLVRGDEIQRRRLAAELHDQVGQNLTTLGINLNILRSLLPVQDNKPLTDCLEDSLKLVANTGIRIRDVMANLRPPVLDDYGLLAALRWFGQRCEAKTGIFVIITGDDIVPRPDSDVETALYRIAQEAVHNVVKHAGAKRIDIHLGFDGREALLIVEDDGTGFCGDREMQNGKRTGWGLEIMKERAVSVGAEFNITSSPGRGVLVTAKVQL